MIRAGLSPIVFGLAAGLGLSALARLGLQPTFQRLIPALDPWVLILVPVFFILAGLLACYGPARRAARIQPTEALRGN